MQSYLNYNIFRRYVHGSTIMRITVYIIIPAHTDYYNSIILILSSMIMQLAWHDIVLCMHDHYSISAATGVNNIIIGVNILLWSCKTS